MVVCVVLRVGVLVTNFASKILSLLSLRVSVAVVLLCGGVVCGFLRVVVMREVVLRVGVALRVMLCVGAYCLYVIINPKFCLYFPLSLSSFFPISHTSIPRASNKTQWCVVLELITGQ